MVSTVRGLTDEEISQLESEESQVASSASRGLTDEEISKLEKEESPKINFTDEEKNIKEPFPFLDKIPGGKELNSAIVDNAERLRNSNPAAFKFLSNASKDYNPLRPDETKMGVIEGITGGIPRAIIEKTTGIEISKGNLAGRIIGSMLPLGYLSKAVKAPQMVKNAVEGAIAMNLVEGIPTDEFLDIGKRIKLSAVGVATGVVAPAFVEGGFKLAKAILTVPKSATNEAVKVIGRLLNATHIKDFAYGKNPPEAIVEALGKDIQSGTFQELQAKVQSAIPRYVQKAKDIIAEKQGDKLLNLSEPLNKEIDAAINKAIEGGRNNQALVTRLINLRDSINYEQTINRATGEVTKGVQRVLDGITPEQGVTLKQQIGGMAKWTGNASDDKLVNMTTKKLYGITNEAIVKAVPESAKPNEIISGLISADNLLNRKIVYEQGSPIFHGAGKIMGSFGMLYGLATGNIKTMIASAEVLGISKIAQSVEAQTKLAYGLSKLGQSARIDFLTRFPKLQPIVEPIMKKFSTPVVQAVRTANAQAKTFASRFTAPLIEEKIKNTNYGGE